MRRRQVVLGEMVRVEPLDFFLERLLPPLEWAEHGAVDRAEVGTPVSRYRGLNVGRAFDRWFS